MQQARALVAHYEARREVFRGIAIERGLLAAYRMYEEDGGDHQDVESLRALRRLVSETIRSFKALLTHEQALAFDDALAAQRLQGLRMWGPLILSDDEELVGGVFILFEETSSE